MNAHNKNMSNGVYFLLALLIGIFILTFFIFKPFLYSLILAIVFVTVFEPIHKKVFFITRNKSALAALFTTTFVFIVIIAPLAFLGVQIFQEATGISSSLIKNSFSTDFSYGINNTIQSFAKFSPVPITSFDVDQYLKQGVSWLLQHLVPLFANVVKVTLGVFVFLIAMYYLFKDGYKLKKAVIALSPLQDVHDETIFNKLELAINSVIKGGLVVALIQGILTAVGFVIFGVPNAALWGSVAAVAALIPGIGTALVLIPAILFLFFSGKTLFAVGFLIWGVTAVGLVDNFLGPKLVERGTQLHPFLILLSILGGISFFGPLGFLLGPLVLSLLFAFIDIYITINKEHKK